jgi:hypothetical protein
MYSRYVFLPITYLKFILHVNNSAFCDFKGVTRIRIRIRIGWHRDNHKILGKKQGCGSEYELDPDSIVSVNPDPDPGGQKWSTKVEKI